MNGDKLQRFGQSLIELDRLLSVKYEAPHASLTGRAVLTFDTGQEISIPAEDGRAIIEAYPNKACKCSAQIW
jgi:hypothetical protein